MDHIHILKQRHQFWQGSPSTGSKFSRVWLCRAWLGDPWDCSGTVKGMCSLCALQVTQFSQSTQKRGNRQSTSNISATSHLPARNSGSLRIKSLKSDDFSFRTSVSLSASSSATAVKQHAMCCCTYRIYYYAPTPRVGAIKPWCTSDVCLSVAYIGPKSRTAERPRKTKTGTDVDHVKRDSNTTSEVKPSTCRGRRHIAAASRTACYI